MNETEFDYLNKKFRFLGFCMLAICLAFWASTTVNSNNLKMVATAVDEMGKIMQRIDMLTVDGELIKIEGYYNPSGEYYCVYSGNKTNEEIISIDEHERFHIHLSDQEQYDHFCIDPYEDYLVDYLEKYKKRIDGG